MKIFRTIFFLILIFNSCVPSFEPSDNDKLYFKKIETPVVTLEWYTYSSAYSDYPEYLVLTKGKVSDTICTCDNIGDVNILDSNNLVLRFLGSPEEGSHLIKIPDTVLNCPVNIDTTYPQTSPTYRKTF